MNRSTRWIVAVVLTAMVLLMTSFLLPPPLQAQTERASNPPRHRLPVWVAVYLGMGGPFGDTRCTPAGYFVPSLEAQTRGRIFFSAGAERIQAVGAIESCLRLPGVSTLPDGRTLVQGDGRFDFTGGIAEGGSHYTLGAGARIPVKGSALEARVKLGAGRGQDEFASHWVPSLGTNLSIAFFSNRVLLSWERRWFHVPYWEKTYSSEEWPGNAPDERPAAAITRSSWQRFGAITLGFRF
jgi:hypothetical protein